MFILLSPGGSGAVPTLVYKVLAVVYQPYCVPMVYHDFSAVLQYLLNYFWFLTSPWLLLSRLRRQWSLCQKNSGDKREKAILFLDQKIDLCTRVKHSEPKSALTTCMLTLFSCIYRTIILRSLTKIMYTVHSCSFIFMSIVVNIVRTSILFFLPIIWLLNSIICNFQLSERILVLCILNKRVFTVPNFTMWTDCW